MILLSWAWVEDLGKKEEKISKNEGESIGMIQYIPIININEACFDRTQILQ